MTDAAEMICRTHVSGTGPISRFRPLSIYRGVQRVNILIISPFFPLPLESGGHTRLFNLIKHLSRRHTVDLVSYITGKQHACITQLDEFCRNIVCVRVDELVRNHRTIIGSNDFRRLWLRFRMLVRGIPPEASAFYFAEMRNTLNDILASNDYDIVQVEYPRMALHLGRSFYENPRILKVLVDYDLSFIAHLRRYQNEKSLFSKIARYMDYKLNRSFALATWKLFDHLITMSQVDCDKVREMLPELSVHVVPNCVDLDYFRPIPREATEMRLLLLGGTGHFPNIDAFSYFTKEIYPRVTASQKNIKLSVIGAGWEHIRETCNDPSITFAGFVEDIRSFITGSVVLLVPIRIGGGTRLKILEAMAMGIPVVSTSVGCEGIAVEHGIHLLLADKPEDFAQRIIDLHSDPELCRRLTDNARELVTQGYGWEAAALRMEKVYGNRNPTAPATRLAQDITDGRKHNRFDRHC